MRDRLHEKIANSGFDEDNILLDLSEIFERAIVYSDIHVMTRQERQIVDRYMDERLEPDW